MIIRTRKRENRMILKREKRKRACKYVIGMLKSEGEG